MSSRPRLFLDADRPLRFAHRGGAALWPENTLAAFRGALDLGIQFLETDAWATRDGVLVLHHDERVDRTTDGEGRISDLPYAELRRLDAGYRFTIDGATFPFRGKGLSIPTLSEAFELSATVRLNVELKAPGEEAARRLWALVDDHALHDRILVAADDDRQVRRFRRYSRGRVATSAGRREALAFWVAARLGLHRFLPVAFDALQVPTRHGGLTVVDRRFVRAAHRHGLQVHVWTIDDPEEMRRLVDLGVDGLMSDRPDHLAALKGGSLGPF